MCGFCGYYDPDERNLIAPSQLEQMVEQVAYRGPDSAGFFSDRLVGFAFRRLSLIDLEGGHQPHYNEDRSLVMVCNGEVFNHQVLRRSLEQRGHRFRSNSDVEVILHLYEEMGPACLTKLNGQFALALYDSRERQLLLARDHAGICPLFYTLVDNTLLFGSEIKSLLAHPAVRREVDLTGLDQLLTFPGLVSPRTMFEGIHSVRPGHYLIVRHGQVTEREFWDLVYPEHEQADYERPDRYYVERLQELLEESVRLRLIADVPVALYLSGGLDSSLIVRLAHRLHDGPPLHAFSIAFSDKQLGEGAYRQELLAQLDLVSHELHFDWQRLSERLQRAVYHSETPLKESYNTASLYLSEGVRAQGIKAILSGEGADELFAGYVGYRFDRFRQQARATAGGEPTLDELLEEEMRLMLWGDADLLYEHDLLAHQDLKLGLYSEGLREQYATFNALNFDLVNQERIRNRHIVHQRSYLDFKLRLADHLVADHGDRMALANSVEGRYPFLDRELIEFATQIPPDLKLRDFTEKYILKEIARPLLPPSIVKREKFAFHTWGSPELLRRNVEWINDVLSFERIKRQGYFDPVAVERLKKRYAAEDFRLNLPFDSDLLIIVLTFGIFLDCFEMPTA